MNGTGVPSSPVECRLLDGNLCLRYHEARKHYHSSAQRNLPERRLHRKHRTRVLQGVLYFAEGQAYRLSKSLFCWCSTSGSNTPAFMSRSQSVPLSPPDSNLALPVLSLLLSRETNFSAGRKRGPVAVSNPALASLRNTGAGTRFTHDARYI
ncbi:hypothetical protein OH77DRAFT_975939 [Trametes cingulata]|nr:hypothetical protein OH77DRAFT_975939 [Trametes cingulata]